MKRVKKRLDNQAAGLLPLLLFMFLDNYFSYLFSFAIGVLFCVICIGMFRLLSKDKIYQFMLLPSAVTLVLYSIFLCLRLEPVLYIYSPLITELLLVVSLTFVGLTKRSVFRRIRESKSPNYERTRIRTTLNEFYFLAQLIQSLYTLHLFAILLYSILPDTMQNIRIEHFLYRQLGYIIGILVILYEQIRLSLIKGSLRKEMWLPVLNEKGKVVGCIARSVSRSLPKKYYHPVIRIAVILNGMLYLVKRSNKDFTSPNMLDYPLRSYILFQHSIKNTIKEMIGDLANEKSSFPRFLLRYTFENEKVKHLVSLYAIDLRSEGQLAQCNCIEGKLWTSRQIEDNLNAGLFSEYFEKEFPYLQSTFLFSDHDRPLKTDGVKN